MGPQAGPQKLGLPGEDSVDGRGTLSIWPQVADDHHAFHEDAKPGDLVGQLGTRSCNSSKKFIAS